MFQRASFAADPGNLAPVQVLARVDRPGSDPAAETLLGLVQPGHAVPLEYGAGQTLVLRLGADLFGRGVLTPEGGEPAPLALPAELHD